MREGYDEGFRAGGVGIRPGVGGQAVEETAKDAGGDNAFSVSSRIG